MKRIFTALALSLAFFVAFTPQTFAAANFFGPIIPDGTNGQPDCTCEDQLAPSGASIPSAPDWGCVMQTMQNLINLAISLSFILAIIYIVYTGFMFVSSAGSPGQREAAKTRLMNVVIGILVVLSAWLIVDFIMKTLYDPQGDANFGPWHQILAGDNENMCFRIADPPDALPGVVAQPSTGGNSDGFVGEPGVIGAGELSHADAAARLSAAGISISSSGNCSNQNNRTCTSLDTIREDSINQIIAIKQACNCSMTVTGGTEIGHEGGPLSHFNGYKIDIGLNDGINAYIQGMTRDGSRGSDPRYRDRCGNEYVRESDHWDITTNNGVCNPPKR
ncbi:MAG TPA: pilin [Candidatus Paceibacterota bacterium]|nr:pilin [Candidatus Paceibacterota bacterium]